MASLKPKLFCGVALWARSVLPREYALERLRAAATRTIYATIIVKRPIVVEQRLHTYRTNWTLLWLLQTVKPETGDYTGVMELCQARNAKGR